MSGFRWFSLDNSRSLLNDNSYRSTEDTQPDQEEPDTSYSDDVKNDETVDNESLNGEEIESDDDESQEIHHQQTYKYLLALLALMVTFFFIEESKD